MTHRAMGVGACKVEIAHRPRQILTVDEAVNGAAMAERLFEQLDGAAAHNAVQVPGYRKQRVAKLLEVETAAIHMPEQAVFRICCPRGANEVGCRIIQERILAVRF